MPQGCLTLFVVLTGSYEVSHGGADPAWLPLVHHRDALNRQVECDLGDLRVVVDGDVLVFASVVVVLRCKGFEGTWKERGGASVVQLKGVHWRKER